MENTKITTIGTRAVGPRTDDDNPFLKQMVCFRSDYMKQIDEKFDKIFDIIASMQLHLQTQVKTKGNESRYDSCVEDTTPFCPTPTDVPKTLATTQAATGPNDLPPLVCFHEKNNIEECCFVETPLPTPFPSQPPKYSHPLPPLFSSEHKIEKISEYSGDVSATIEKIEVNIVEIGSGISSNRWSGLMKIQLLADCKQVYRIVNGNYKFGCLEFFKQVAADHNVRKILVNASRSAEGKKNKWITWSFDPGGCHVFDESFNKRIYEFQFFDSHGRSLIVKLFCLDEKRDADFVSRICMGVSLADHFVNPRMTDFYSSFRLQIVKVVTLFSKASSFGFLLCNASKNVSFSSVSSMIELRFVIDSKLNWIFQVTATLNIVDLLEIVCLGLVEVDFTKVSSYRIISTSVFSRRQSTKYLYNETIHHRILVQWVYELIDCAFAIGLSASKYIPSWRIKLSLESNFSLFYMFYVVTTGSFGGKDSFQAAEPILVFKGLLGYSFTWGVRGALVELVTILFLEKWSYVVWKWIVWEQIWFGWVIEIWPEFGSFKDDGFKAIPSLWNGTFREREEFNISHCKRKLIGVRWYIKDYEAKFGGLYTEGGAEFLSTRDAEGHGRHTSSIVAGAMVENVSFTGLARGGAPSARLVIFKVFWAMGSCSSDDIFVAFDDATRNVMNGVTVVVGLSAIVNFGTLVLGHLQLSRGDTTLSRGEYCHVHNYDGIGIKGRRKGFIMGIEEGVLVETLSGEVSDTGVGKEVRFNIIFLLGRFIGLFIFYLFSNVGPIV